MKIGPIIFLCFLLVANSTCDTLPVLAEPYFVQERFLIITADDFGASRNINEGILLAVSKNSISAISVLANFAGSLPELRVLAQKHPEIGIGVHLNITTGKPVLAAEQVPTLVNDSGNFYTIDELLPRINTISCADLRKELRAQIDVLEKNNIRIDHLSDHSGILSFYGPFFDIITELASEFTIPIRTPVIASVKYPEMFPNSEIKKRGRQAILKLAVTDPTDAVSLLRCSRIDEMEKKAGKLDELGILHPDLLVESFWGNPTPSNYKYILEHLPFGTSELILHLGTYARQEFYPTGLDLSFFNFREDELITVTSDYLKQYYSYLNIKIIGFSDIKRVR